MSETATSLRSLSGAEEFDRHMRSLNQTPATATTDALAELARLVGHQDPFGASSIRKTDVPPTAFEPAGVERSAFNRVTRSGDYDMGEEPGAPTEPAMVQPTVSGPEPWERAVPRYPSISVRDPRPVEQSPDAWAAGVTRDAPPEAPSLTATREDATPAAAPGPKRTLVVLAAVLLLTGGGLAASFLVKPSTSTAVVDAASGTPTILAATGPSKVQPATPAAGADTPSEPSTLLDKNNNDGTTAAKVVNNVEQPLDLSQAVKPSAGDNDGAAPSPFPTPRKVRTVLVRPDGSIIPDSTAASVALPTDGAQPSPASQQATLAFDPTTALPMRQPDAQPAAAQPDVPAAAVPLPSDTAPPASGKTTTRATAIKPAASTTQQGSAAAQNRSPVSTPKTRPVAKPKPAPVAATPNAVADAAPPPADVAPTAPASGGYAVQLGAAPGEAEAKATAGRLASKYSADLGGASPLVVKAQAGAKTVYRIRLGGLSQDGAKAICAKVQSAGGGCFVARN